MKLKLEDLANRSHAWYNDPGQQRLREKDAFNALVRHSRHAITLPPSIIGRAMPIRTGVGREKIDHSKAILSDPKGVAYRVTAQGMSQKAERQRERVQAALTAIYRLIRLECGRDFESNILEDVLLYARGAVRVLPRPIVWLDEAPDLDDSVNLQDEVSVDGITTKVNEYFTKVESAEKAWAEARRRALPIDVQWVPARCLIPRWDGKGLAEMLEYRTVPIRQVLDDWLDENGKPLAKELEDSVTINDLTDSDTVQLVIRSDRAHVQIALIGLVTDESIVDRNDAHVGSPLDCILWQGEHGMGVVPYAWFSGREASADEPMYRYYGLLDDIAEKVVALDYVCTQRATSARFGAWPQIVIERDKDAPGQSIGDDDKATPFVIDEGGITENLGPGEKMVPIPWISPDVYRLLDQTEAQLRADIDRATFGRAAYGDTSVDSGYLQNQLQEATTALLEPFLIGLQDGHARLADLILRCCRTLRAMGLPPLEVAHYTDEEQSFVRLTDDVLSLDWVIEAEIRPRPVGGRRAQAETLAFLEDRGYITHLMAIAETGNPYPQRTYDAWMAEQIAKSPPAMQELTNRVIQRTLAAITQAMAPNVTGGPIPQGLVTALAGMGQPPDASAVMGMYGVGPGGGPPPPSIGQGGNPGTPGSNPTGQPPVGAPGGGMGQAQPMPGGMARQGPFV